MTIQTLERERKGLFWSLFFFAGGVLSFQGAKALFDLIQLDADEPQWLALAVYLVPLAVVVYTARRIAHQVADIGYVTARRASERSDAGQSDG